MNNKTFNTKQQKLIDQKVEKSEYAEQINELVEKYQEILNLENLEDEMTLEEIGQNLDKEKNQKLYEFKFTLLQEFTKLQQTIQQKTIEIVISKFPKNLQPELSKNKTKYFEMIPGETQKKFETRQTKELKLLLAANYKKENPKAKIEVINAAINVQYINIFACVNPEFQKMKANELNNLINEINKEWELTNETQEENACEDFVVIDIENKPAQENTINQSTNQDLQQSENQPSWTNFIIEGIKEMVKKGYEIISKFTVGA